MLLSSSFHIHTLTQVHYPELLFLLFYIYSEWFICIVPIRVANKLYQAIIYYALPAVCILRALYHNFCKDNKDESLDSLFMILCQL